MHHHSGCALDKRLDHERSDLVVMTTQQLFGLRKKKLTRCLRRGASWQATWIGKWRPDRFEQQRLEQRVETCDAADARASQRIAVIRFTERDKLCLARLWVFTLTPILKC